MKRLSLILCFGLVIAGCQKKEDPVEENPDFAASAELTEEKTDEPEAEEEDEPMDLPTEEDFEEEAIEEINAQNLDAELDKLEEEIGG